MSTPQAAFTPPASAATPKRILALDGGGVRGIVTIAFLEDMEAKLRAETGQENLVLADHFDLIGGTSVGSIIATMLALGWDMDKVASTFKAWAPEIFGGASGFGFFGSKFSERVLEEKLAETLGDMQLDSPELKTKLAIVTKRLDTGSPWWIVTNNPRSIWWNGPEAGQKNHAFKVADLIRASTAAPTIFKPKPLPVVPGQPPGVFVDGGLSPFNSPALALLMIARLNGHGLCWPLGADNLHMVSVGTGIWRDPVGYGFWNRRIAALFAVQALRGMITDSQMLSLAIMQWMSNPRRPWPINTEIGDMAGECLGAGLEPHAPLLKYQRYDLEVEAAKLAPMMENGKPPSQRRLNRLRSLDDPGELETLYQLAKKAAADQVSAVDFL